MYILKTSHVDTIKFMHVMESKFSKIHPEKFSNKGRAPGAPALDPPLVRIYNSAL